MGQLCKRCKRTVRHSCRGRRSAHVKYNRDNTKNTLILCGVFLQPDLGWGCDLRRDVRQEIGILWGEERDTPTQVFSFFLTLGKGKYKKYE